MKNYEEALHEQAKEFKKLWCKLLEQEKMLVKLKVKGRYAFCVCMFWGKECGL
jgi:hypothetical protein